MHNVIMMATQELPIDKLLDSQNLVSVIDATDKIPCRVWLGDDMFVNGKYESIGMPGAPGHSVYSQIRDLLLTDISSGAMYVETIPRRGLRMIWNGTKLLQGTERISVGNKNSPDSWSYLNWHDKKHTVRKMVYLGYGTVGCNAATKLAVLFNSGCFPTY